MDSGAAMASIVPEHERAGKKRHVDKGCRAATGRRYGPAASSRWWRVAGKTAVIHPICAKFVPAENRVAVDTSARVLVNRRLRLVRRDSWLGPPGERAGCDRHEAHLFPTSGTHVGCLSTSSSRGGRVVVGPDRQAATRRASQDAFRAIWRGSSAGWTGRQVPDPELLQREVCDCFEPRTESARHPVFRLEREHPDAGGPE